MDWLITLYQEDSVAHAIIAIEVVIAAGLALGHLRVMGVSLGVSGVLFAGLICSHFGLTVNHHVLEFTRELGLVFFVFTIGLQVGPGVFASLKRHGLAAQWIHSDVIIFTPHRVTHLAQANPTGMSPSRPVRLIVIVERDRNNIIDHEAEGTAAFI